MRKHLSRIVAALLVASLLWDPAFARVFPAGIPRAPVMEANGFQEEALINRLLAAFTSRDNQPEAARLRHSVPFAITPQRWWGEIFQLASGRTKAFAAWMLSDHGQEILTRLKIISRDAFQAAINMNLVILRELIGEAIAPDQETEEFFASRLRTQFAEWHEKGVRDPKTLKRELRAVVDESVKDLQAVHDPEFFLKGRTEPATSTSHPDEYSRIMNTIQGWGDYAVGYLEGTLMVYGPDHVIDTNALEKVIRELKAMHRHHYHTAKPGDAVLVSPSQAQSAPVRHRELRSPTDPLLEALGLNHPENIPGVRILEVRTEQDLLIRRLQLPPRPDLRRFPSGSEILQYELANPLECNLTTFDLLYNAEGHLIAVFPVPPESSNLDKSEIEYFDLSPYYWRPPPMGTPELNAKFREELRSFAKKREKDLGAIEAYKKIHFGADRYKISAVRSGDGGPFFYAEIDKMTGEWHTHALDFSNLELSIPDVDSDRKAQIVLLNFPTVYSPVFKEPGPDNAYEALGNPDAEYMQELYLHLRKKNDPRVLLVGPGTGVDAWIASLCTGKPIYSIGLNPLEIANLRATAAIAGFEVIPEVRDNILSDDGSEAFPEDTFDTVAWDMPDLDHFEVSTDPTLRPSRLHQYVDGDHGGVALRRFARGLLRKLTSGGQGIAWNRIPSDSRSTDEGRDTYVNEGLVVVASYGGDRSSDGNSYVTHILELSGSIRLGRATVGVLAGNSRHSKRGTGVIIGENSDYWYVLTNRHVVENHAAFKIFFSGGQHVAAELVGSDEMLTDLAVLKFLKSETPKGVALEKVSLAEDTDANYWAKEQPVTVSTMRTSIQTVRTDLAIPEILEPGSSGSPVGDANGHLVGVINGVLPSRAQTVFVSVRSIHRFLTATAVPGVQVAGPRANLFPKGHPLHPWTITIETAILAVIMIPSILYAPALFHPASPVGRIAFHILGYIAGMITANLLLPVLHGLGPARYNLNQIMTLMHYYWQFAFMFFPVLIGVFLGELSHEFWGVMPIMIGSYFATHISRSLHNSFDILIRRIKRNDPDEQKPALGWLLLFTLSFTGFIHSGRAIPLLQSAWELLSRLPHLGPGQLSVDWFMHPFLLLLPLPTALLIAFSYGYLIRTIRQNNRIPVSQHQPLPGTVMAGAIFGALGIAVIAFMLNDQLLLPSLESFFIAAATVAGLTRIPFLLHPTAKPMIRSRWIRSLIALSVLALILQWWLGIFNSPPPHAQSRFIPQAA